MSSAAKTLPSRLRKEPLLEAVWEVRFSPTQPSIGELLPGILFQRLGAEYREVVRLPAADIPGPVADQDPALRYAPRVRLRKGNRAVSIGQRVVSLSCGRPYSGWQAFSDEIRQLAGAIEKTALVDRLERFSLKYIDLIALDEPGGLACLAMQLRLGDHTISTEPVQLRTEIREDHGPVGEITHIVQIVSPGEVSLPGQSGTLRGVLVDIDTIRPLGEAPGWSEMYDSLDTVHAASKRRFFDMLAQTALEKLEPEYED